MGLTPIIPAQLVGPVLVDGTGVGNFFGNAEFVELVDDLARLHFQLPRQFIDSNLTHINAFRLRRAPVRAWGPDPDRVQPRIALARHSPPRISAISPSYQRR